MPGKEKSALLSRAIWLSFLTPIIAWPITLFTKKINKTKKIPTYRQCLEYENTTAMLIAAILYIVFGLLIYVVEIMGHAYGISGNVVPIILFVWGISLFSERHELMRAKKVFL